MGLLNRIAVRPNFKSAAEYASDNGFSRRLFHGTNVDFKQPKGTFWATPQTRAANDYAINMRNGGAPQVMPIMAKTDGALHVESLSDIARVLGPEDASRLLQRYDDIEPWAALDDPAVAEALRRRGVTTVYMPNDASPSSVNSKGLHESYAFLTPENFQMLGSVAGGGLIGGGLLSKRQF